jgi:hypothetical protein
MAPQTTQEKAGGLAPRQWLHDLELEDAALAALKERQMTGPDLYAARFTLGHMWGLGRPLRMAEMGRALRLSGRDPGASIRDYERGTTRISGPMAVAVQMMLAGALPPDGLECLKA